MNQFESVRDTSKSANGYVTCWLEAVQYILRSYAASSAIHAALHDLRGIEQLEGEDANLAGGTPTGTDRR